MSRRSSWKFHVQGSLSDGEGGSTLRAYEAIIESGVRLDTSPHDLEGAGPIAQPNDQGLFNTFFLTIGADRLIERPESISIFLRVGKGKWKPYVVAMNGRKTELLSEREMLIDLGVVAIDINESTYVDEG